MEDLEASLRILAERRHRRIPRPHRRALYLSRFQAGGGVAPAEDRRRAGAALIPELQCREHVRSRRPTWSCDALDPRGDPTGLAGYDRPAVVLTEGIVVDAAAITALGCGHQRTDIGAGDLVLTQRSQVRA